jgi:TPP-dependent pyruvate/acetoin dehydrogenase alpha subunit
MQEDVATIKALADSEVAEAQKFAEESPEPAPEDAFDAVFAASHS